MVRQGFVVRQNRIGGCFRDILAVVRITTYGASIVGLVVTVRRGGRSSRPGKPNLVQHVDALRGNMTVLSFLIQLVLTTL